MCEPQSRAKYLVRNSPPYPANKCCGRQEKGNDGMDYVSRRTSTGICRWVPVSWNTQDKLVTKKRSTKKRSTRNTPPGMARDFKGLVKRGQDNKMYISSTTRDGKWVWRPKVKK